MESPRNIAHVVSFEEIDEFSLGLNVVIHWREMKLFAVGLCTKQLECGWVGWQEESWPQDSSEVGIRRA